MSPPIPPLIEKTLRHFWTCEFTTLAKDGTPITWPVYPMYLARRGQILIASPIGYPQKPCMSAAIRAFPCFTPSLPEVG